MIIMIFYIIVIIIIIIIIITIIVIIIIIIIIIIISPLSLSLLLLLLLLSLSLLFFIIIIIIIIIIIFIWTTSLSFTMNCLWTSVITIFTIFFLQKYLAYSLTPADASSSDLFDICQKSFFENSSTRWWNTMTFGVIFTQNCKTVNGY